ncbi:MAG: cysteine--tRNA ligase [Candidatus Omnitrophica bacterium]|nr:cysteine--tRNA ligase [Candidatus Omnitrophota bacterium]
MPLFIYNTLTRKKEEFIPLNPPQVKMYTCGVTVYDDCHIGHARSLYIFDVIRRYLEYRKFKVNFVRNITDVDDKIINRANELKIDWRELVDKYIDSYKKDLELLSIRPGIMDGKEEPRATKNIPEMIKYIEDLIDKGYAYLTDNGVYFSVRKFKDYGKLSGQGIDQMLSGVRIEADEHKKDPLDFALWKKSKPNEPEWPSPWREGRPGWHIECSIMAQKYLGETLDIHGGGRDLIFPHHENEIAQSEAITGKPFAKYWIHHGLLTINGQKMAKSLGNFVTIKDLVKRYNDPNILKMFFLSAHYTSPIDFTWEKMKEEKQALERIMILIDKIDRKLTNSELQVADKNFKEIENIKNRFKEVMDDDFNMPQGLASIFDLVNIVNKDIDNPDFIFAAKNLLFELTEIFGLDLKKRKAPLDDLAASITPLIKERNEARKKHDFQKADKIRKDLEQKGILLEDTKAGTIWRRK